MFPTLYNYSYLLHKNVLITVSQTVSSIVPLNINPVAHVGGNLIV